MTSNQGVHPMTPSGREVHLAALFRLMEPKLVYLRYLSKAGLSEELAKIKIEVYENQKKFERKGHRRANLREGDVQNLSTTGWGLFGDLEFPLTIREEYLAPSSPSSDLSETAILPGALSDREVSKASINIFLGLPPEIIIKIFEYINPVGDLMAGSLADRTYGRGALALSCKALARISKKTRVLKTILLIPPKAGTKLCIGCAKARPDSRHYWDNKVNEIKSDWDTYGETHIPFNHRYEEMILNWLNNKSGVACMPEVIKPQIWCPACQAQQRWEAFEGSKLLSKGGPNGRGAKHQERFTRMLYVEKLLGEDPCRNRC